MLAYNCSPSFNWKKKLDDLTIARFQKELAAMGYKFQFITLAGFHALNLSMFELARAYRSGGMTAHARLQEKEFSREFEHGYEAVKHQRFVGTGYFDVVTQVITGGNSSTTALEGSTEAAQFSGLTMQVPPGVGPHAGCQPHPWRMPASLRKPIVCRRDASAFRRLKKFDRRRPGQRCASESSPLFLAPVQNSPLSRAFRVSRTKSGTGRGISS